MASTVSEGVGIGGSVHRGLVGGGGRGRCGDGRGEVEDRGERGLLLQHGDGVLEAADMDLAETGVERQGRLHSWADEGIGAEGELGDHLQPGRPQSIRRANEPGVVGEEEVPVLKSQE